MLHETIREGLLAHMYLKMFQYQYDDSQYVSC